MKYLILAYLFIQPLSAFSSELSYFINLPTISGGLRDFAAVAWDDKSCTLGSSYSLPWCPQPGENTFYSPTVLIFKGKTGELIRSIKFFGEDCPYSPIDLAVNGKKLTLTVHTIGIRVSSSFDPSSSDLVYPIVYRDSCHYPIGTILRETRHLKTGKLYRNVILENYKTVDLP